MAAACWGPPRAPPWARCLPARWGLVQCRLLSYVKFGCWRLPDGGASCVQDTRCLLTVARLNHPACWRARPLHPACHMNQLAAHAQCACHPPSRLSHPPSRPSCSGCPCGGAGPLLTQLHSALKSAALVSLLPPDFYPQVAHVEVLARFYISRHEYSKAAQARQTNMAGAWLGLADCWMHGRAVATPAIRPVAADAPCGVHLSKDRHTTEVCDWLLNPPHLPSTEIMSPLLPPDRCTSCWRTAPRAPASRPSAWRSARRHTRRRCCRWVVMR